MFSLDERDLPEANPRYNRALMACQVGNSYHNKRKALC